MMVFIAALVLGLSSSLHCMGMCGPLIMSVPFGKSFAHKALYFSGKALAYAALGTVVGMLGMNAIWGESQQYISIVAGVVLLLLVLFPFIGKGKIFAPVQKAIGAMFKQMQERARWWQFIGLGFLNGLLPCGMVYVALSTALASGSAVNGFIAMLFFGLGTTPSLWSMSWLKSKLHLKYRKQLKPVSIGLSVAVGLLLILRGMNLGVPYISPKMQQEKPSCCSPAAATCH